MTSFLIESNAEKNPLLETGDVRVSSAARWKVAGCEPIVETHGCACAPDSSGYPTGHEERMAEE